MLEISGLGSHYGRIEALKGISLVVREGELVALVGANGAGKTTLLRTLSGLQPASSGRILFDGDAPRGDRRLHVGELAALERRHRVQQFPPARGITLVGERAVVQPEPLLGCAGATVTEGHHCRKNQHLRSVHRFFPCRRASRRDRLSR